jgi:xanthosine utilization system XapX-like protein
VAGFVGGFIWNLIQYHRLAPHKFHLAGIIGSILGAIVVLLVLRMTGTEKAGAGSTARSAAVAPRLDAVLAGKTTHVRRRGYSSAS